MISAETTSDAIVITRNPFPTDPSAPPRSEGIACQASIWWYVDPFERALAEARALGFAGVEIFSDAFERWDRSPEAMARSVAEEGLRVPALYSSLVLGDPSRASAAREAARRLFEVCARLGAPRLILGSPPVAQGGRIAIPPLAEALDAVAAEAASAGVSVSYQPHFGGSVETPEEIEDLLARTDPARVSLCLDTGHAYLGGGDWFVLARRWRPRIGYIQLKDARRAPRTLAERGRLLAEWIALGRPRDWAEAARPLLSRLLRRRAPDFVEAGRGEVDFSNLETFLAESGYTGWICLEIDAPSLLARRSLAESLGHLSALSPSLRAWAG